MAVDGSNCSFNSGISMTWLERLEKVFRQRTEGPWVFSDCGDCEPDFYGAELASPTKGVIQSWDYEGYSSGINIREVDARFIALVGTIGGELLEVVRAAEGVHTWEDSPNPKAAVLYDDALFELGRAIAALKAKVEGTT